MDRIRLKISGIRERSGLQYQEQERQNEHERTGKISMYAGAYAKAPPNRGGGDGADTGERKHEEEKDGNEQKDQ